MSPVKNENDQSQRPKKQTALETADQMFKDAFLIIKTRFHKQHPNLSEEALNQMTADYFKKLNLERS